MKWLEKVWTLDITYFMFFFLKKNLKFNSYNEEEEIQTTDASIKNTKRCQPIDALYITYFMLKFNQDQIRNNGVVTIKHESLILIINMI